MIGKLKIAKLSDVHPGDMMSTVKFDGSASCLGMCISVRPYISEQGLLCRRVQYLCKSCINQLWCRSDEAVYVP